MGIPILVPMASPAVDLKTGKFTNTWIDLFLEMTLDLSKTAQRLAAVALTALSAAVGVTPLPAGLAGAGIYRVTYEGRIVQAATTSSSLIIAIGWTQGGIPSSKPSVALTTNVVGDVVTGSETVQCDAAIALTYSTTYVSVGGVPMKYSLNVTVEALT